MEDTSNAVLQRVQSAAIDGRMKTLRFRQRQFQSLHRHLVQYRERFIEAAQLDDDCTKEEAQVAYASALIELRNHYDDLDLKTDMEQEYSIAKGKTNAGRQIAFDITYIIPDPLSLLFSVLSALSGAIEAGSCCVLELESTTRKTPALLREAFAQALDTEAFGITSSRAPAEYLSGCLVIDQVRKLTSEEANLAMRLLTSPDRSNVALVDRTADIDLAAREIVTSRMLYGGRGRHSMDLVLMNEYKSDELIEALITQFKAYQATTKQMGNTSQTNYHRPKPQSSANTLLHQEVQQGRAKFLYGNFELGILEVTERRSSLAHQKMPSPVIVVTRFTSLDDPIDLLNQVGEQPAIGALYLFAGARESKYLSQYISSQVTCTNHVPAQLQVGPTAPLGYPISLRTRYSRAMFEYPSPQIVAGSKSHLISNLLGGSANPTWLLSVAQKPLKPTGQLSSGAWGFFEQGMVVGALVYLLPIVSVSLFGMGYAGVLSYRKLFNS